MLAISRRAAPAALRGTRLYRRHASLLQGGKLFIVQNPIQERGLLAEWSSFGVEVVDRDKAIQFVDYHWNLSTMLKQSREVGFRMLALAELPDAPGGNPRGAPWLCFEFDKA